jgi:hypothetical protein
MFQGFFSPSRWSAMVTRKCRFALFFILFLVFF